MLICFCLLAAGSDVDGVRLIVLFCRGTRSTADRVWVCGFPRGGPAFRVLVRHLGRAGCVMPRWMRGGSGRGCGVGAALAFRGLGDMDLPDLTVDVDMLGCISARGECSSR